MNKEQLQQQIEYMKNKLVEMEAELNKPEVVINYWQPKDDEFFYWANHLGGISNNMYNPLIQEDKLRYRVFKTREEADRYTKYVKAEETLKRVIAEANEGWLPNWDGSIYNYNIRLHNNNLTYVTSLITKELPNFMYIKSDILCNKLIKEYEKEFKTYLSY